MALGVQCDITDEYLTLPPAFRFSRGDGKAFDFFAFGTELVDDIDAHRRRRVFIDEVHVTGRVDGERGHVAHERYRALELPVRFELLHAPLVADIQQVFGTTDRDQVPVSLEAELAGFGARGAGGAGVP